MRRPVDLILSLGLMGVIVLTLVLVSRPTQREVRGVVRDAAGPVADAVVRVRGAASYVRTDENGAFLLLVNAADQAAQLTAWAPGYFVGGSNDMLLAGPVALVLHKHPTTDNPAYALISPVLDKDNPTACSRCHSDRSGEMQGAMPVEEWLQDAHSGAAVNPRFLSLYHGTALDGTAGQPTAYRFDPDAGIDVPVGPSLGLDAVGPGFRLDYPGQAGSCAACHVPVAALAAPYTADPALATGVAGEGVTCDFCHKIRDVRLRPDGRPDPGLPGVLSIDFLRPHAGEQVFIGPLDDTPGDDIYSSLQNESAFCAPCHTGQFWDMSIYNSYGEWLASPYSDPENGKTCQDCHMPPSGATTFVQLPPEDAQAIPARDPQTIFSHRMPGAADQALLEATATLEVVARRTGERVLVTAHVSNTGAGHHIPTDNPLRNMILVVEAAGPDGHPLPLLNGPVIPAWGGIGDPAEGYYAGLPGVLYAKLLADFYTGETPTYAYWRQTRLISDNRIPALGTDESTYAFALPADAGPVTVTTRLYLRRAFIALMALKGWDTPDRLMAQQAVSVP